MTVARFASDKKTKAGTIAFKESTNELPIVSGSWFYFLSSVVSSPIIASMLVMDLEFLAIPVGCLKRSKAVFQRVWWSCCSTW